MQFRLRKGKRNRNKKMRKTTSKTHESFEISSPNNNGHEYKQPLLGGNNNLKDNDSGEYISKHVDTNLVDDVIEATIYTMPFYVIIFIWILFILSNILMAYFMSNEGWDIGFYGAIPIAFVALFLFPAIFIAIRLHIICISNVYCMDLIIPILTVLYVILYIALIILVLTDNYGILDNEVVLIISGILSAFMCLYIVSKLMICYFRGLIVSFMAFHAIAMYCFMISGIIYNGYDKSTKNGIDQQTISNNFEWYVMRSFCVFFWISMLSLYYEESMQEYTTIYYKKWNIFIFIWTILIIIGRFIYYLVSYTNTNDANEYSFLVINNSIGWMSLLFLIYYLKTLPRIAVTTFIFINVQPILSYIYKDDENYQKIDIFLSLLSIIVLVCITILKLNLHFGVVFTNFYSKDIRNYFNHLSNDHLYKVYQIYRRQKYNNKLITLSSNIKADWIDDYSPKSNDQTRTIQEGIKATTQLHLKYTIKYKYNFRMSTKAMQSETDKISSRASVTIYSLNYKFETETIDIFSETLRVQLKDDTVFHAYYPTCFEQIRCWNNLSTKTLATTFNEHLGMFTFYTK